MFSLLLQEIVLRRLWTRRLLRRSENDRRRFSSATGPDLEQSSTAPAMQPASPDRNPAIRLGAWTPNLRRSRRSRRHSPEEGAIGTSKTHYLLDTLDGCYTTSSCESGASLRTVDIAPCEEPIARGPRLWRRELFPPTPSMPQPASAQEPAPHHPPRHDEVGWMLHPILGQIPDFFFLRGRRRAAAGSNR